MRQSPLLVITFTLLATLAARHASAAGPNENFYGIWQWKSGVHSTTQVFDNPTEACIQAIAEQAMDQPGEHFTFVKAKRRLTPVTAFGTPFDTGNEYDCVRHRKNPDKDETISPIAANFICPDNADLTLLKNDGMARNRRCKCKPTETSCHSPMPPAYDNTSRCVPPTSGKVQAGPPPVSQSDPNAVLEAAVALALVKARYANIVAQVYPNATDCNFAPADVMTTRNIGKLCGFRQGDAYAANKAAGLTATPAGFTWHHDLKTMGEMKLVRTTAHQACGHTGGGAVWSKMTGEIGTASKPGQYRNALPPLYSALSPAP